MSEEARFYVVFQTLWTQRVTSSAARHDLHLSGRADFRMRADKSEPFLSVFELSKRPVDSPHSFRGSVRDADGAVSPEYQRIRLELGVGGVNDSR
jgi:hypothetical protein